MKIYLFKETLSYWWEFSNLIQIDHFDESSSLQLQQSSLMKGKLLDTNSSLRRNSIALMKIPYFRENSVNMIEIDSIMKTYHCNKIHHYDENLWPQIYHFYYLGSVHQCDQR